MKTITISSNQDFSGIFLNGIFTSIVFQNPAVATFEARQFDDTQISTSVEIVGADGYSSGEIDVNWTTAQNFSAAFWSFTNFDGLIRLHATSSAEVIVGSEVNDFFYVSGADTDYGGGGNDTFFYSTPTDVTAGQNLYGGVGNNSLLLGFGDFDFSAVSFHDIQRLIFNPGNNSATFTASAFAAFTTVFGNASYGTQRLIINGDSIDISGVSLLDWSRGIAVLNGGAGNDTLTGSNFGDSLSGGDGADNLIGGGGDDTLDGGGGLDTLAGGEGNDTYVLASVYSSGNVPRFHFVYDYVTEAADQGTDTVLVQWSSSFVNSYTLAANVENGGILGTHSFALYGNELDNHLTANDAGDTLGGGDGNDTLNGGAGADSLSGDGGGDLLLGAGGGDTLAGGAGKDTLDGGAGADSLIGGAGIDAADYSGSPSGVNVDLAAGTGVGGDADGDTLSGIENLIGSAFNDTLAGDGKSNHLHGGAGLDTLAGGDGNDNLDGGEGNDSIHGDAGNDTLTGGTGADSLFGDAGNDKLDGGGGGDSLNGGDGNDTILASSGKDSIDGGLGTDLLDLSAHFHAGATVNMETGRVNLGGGSTATFFGIEAVLGTTGDDHMAGSGDADRLMGNAGIDTLLGHAGNDTLIGGDGGDSLAGNGGDDLLLGGAGSDSLDGGAGNDTLRGGQGGDSLTGGAGNDFFDFNAIGESNPSPALRDTIADFSQGQDKIDLSTIDANTGNVGNDAFDFIGVSGFTNVAGQLHETFNQANNTTIISGDVDGNGSGDFQIVLNGHYLLTADDFVL